MAIVTPSTAAGEVAFYAGTAILETEPLVNGQATFTAILLPSGSQTITAYYTGDSTHAPSTSAQLIETVKTVSSRSYSAPAFLSAPGGALGAIAVGDFNDDGKPDLAVTTETTGGVEIFLGNGDGTFQLPVTYGSTASSSNQLVVADFNGDGKADLAFSSGYNPQVLSVILGNGDGSFQPPMSSRLLRVPNSLQVGDFNRDGKADLVITDNSGILIFLGNGDGTFEPSVTYGPEQYFDSSPAIGDFNGDGNVDLAVDSSGQPGTGLFSESLLLGNGDGTFQPPVMIADFAFSAPLAADLNGDGYEDLVGYVNKNQLITVLLGKGDLAFQPPTSYVSNVIRFRLSDVNADGQSDLLGVTNAGTNVGVMLGNPDGTFQNERYYSATSDNSEGYSGQMVLADFNGDGRPDIAAILNNGGFVGIQLASTAAVTTTSLKSSPEPSLYGLDVTLTATVAPSSGAGVVPGVVTFVNGTDVLGHAALSNGVATLIVSTLPLGLNTLSAVYEGDPYYLTSTSAPVSQEVIVAPTSTTLYSTPNPSTVGQPVDLVAKISPPAATGTVNFYRGPTLIGSAAISKGTATITTSTLSQGNHSLTATYLGSVDYSASVSRIVIQVVQ